SPTLRLFRWLFRRRRPSAPPTTVPSVPPTPASADLGRVPGGFAVIDVETTGLSPGRDRVVEIAVVRTDRHGRVVDEWATLINPSGRVGAAHIHGITVADVRAAPRFADVAGELVARMAGNVVVAHNAAFDVAFLRAEFERAGWPMPAVPVLCTLEA